jgi:hypothetical protein
MASERTHRPLMNKAKRIAIIGSAGVGKTTLARQIAGSFPQHVSSGTGFLHVELDLVPDSANGRFLPGEVFRSAIESALAAEYWVADSDDKRIIDILWTYADTVIWLDYNLFVILWRLVRRMARRAISREKLMNGKPQSLYRELFTNKSLFWWAIKSYRGRKYRFLNMMKQSKYQNLTIYRFVTPRQTSQWLAEFEGSNTTHVEHR